MIWQINIEADKQLVENLIKYRKTELFKTKYRAIVFKEIERINKKINPKSTLSYNQKDELLDAFIGNLLDDNAWRLKAYLHSKRLSIQDDLEENKKSYTLVSSQEIIGDEPTCDENGFPTLKSWVFEQCDFFVRAKLIIDGVTSLNTDVINIFLYKYKKPGCLSMISKWIYDNKVYSGESQFYNDFVLRITQEFESDLFNKKSLRNQFQNFRYKKEFYSYFKLWILTPYLRAKFFPKAPNPIIPRKKKDKDPTTDIVLNEEIDSLYPDKKGKDSPRLSDKKKMEKDELLEKISVERRIKVSHLLTSIDVPEESNVALNLKSPDDISSHIEHREMVEKIFRVMSRTPSGQKQVEVLKYLFLEKYEVGGFVPTDKEIAKVLNISVGNLRTIKNRALETAREIAEILGLEL